MKARLDLLFVTVLLVSTSLFAQDAIVTKLLKDAGATSFSMNEKYGSGIGKMYVGYDASDKPIVGVAERSTKTYKKVNTVIAVVPDGDAYKISAAEISDMNKLPGASKDYASDALKDITGKVLPDSAGARGLVDSVSGATKQYKAIYISYSLMASKVIDELNANPDWERKPLP